MHEPKGWLTQVKLHWAIAAAGRRAREISMVWVRMLVWVGAFIFKLWGDPSFCFAHVSDGHD